MALTAPEVDDECAEPGGEAGNDTAAGVSGLSAAALASWGNADVERDSNRRPSAYEAITQSCDPSKMLKDGQEAASMFLDGNRTRIFSFSRDALTQLSYPVR